MNLIECLVFEHPNMVRLKKSVTFLKICFPLILTFKKFYVLRENKMQGSHPSTLKGSTPDENSSIYHHIHAIKNFFLK